MEKKVDLGHNFSLDAKIENGTAEIDFEYDGVYGETKLSHSAGVPALVNGLKSLVSLLAKPGTALGDVLSSGIDKLSAAAAK